MPFCCCGSDSADVSNPHGDMNGEFGVNFDSAIKKPIPTSSPLAYVDLPALGDILKEHVLDVALRGGTKDASTLPRRRVSLGTPLSGSATPQMGSASEQQSSNSFKLEKPCDNSGNYQEKQLGCEEYIRMLIRVRLHMLACLPPKYSPRAFHDVGNRSQRQSATAKESIASALQDVWMAKDLSSFFALSNKLSGVVSTIRDDIAKQTRQTGSTEKTAIWGEETNNSNGNVQRSVVEFEQLALHLGLVKSFPAREKKENATSQGSNSTSVAVSEAASSKFTLEPQLVAAGRILVEGMDCVLTALVEEMPLLQERLSTGTPMTKRSKKATLPDGRSTANTYDILEEMCTVFSLARSLSGSGSFSTSREGLRTSIDSSGQQRKSSNSTLSSLSGLLISTFEMEVKNIDGHMNPFHSREKVQDSLFCEDLFHVCCVECPFLPRGISAMSVLRLIVETVLFLLSLLTGHFGNVDALSGLRRSILPLQHQEKWKSKALSKLISHFPFYACAHPSLDFVEVPSRVEHETLYWRAILFFIGIVDARAASFSFLLQQTSPTMAGAGGIGGHLQELQRMRSSSKLKRVNSGARGSGLGGTSFQSWCVKLPLFVLQPDAVAFILYLGLVVNGLGRLNLRGVPKHFLRSQTLLALTAPVLGEGETFPSADVSSLRIASAAKFYNYFETNISFAFKIFPIFLMNPFFQHQSQPEEGADDNDDEDLSSFEHGEGHGPRKEYFDLIAASICNRWLPPVEVPSSVCTCIGIFPAGSVEVLNPSIRSAAKTNFYANRYEIRFRIFDTELFRKLRTHTKRGNKGDFCSSSGPLSASFQATTSSLDPSPARSDSLLMKKELHMVPGDLIEVIVSSSQRLVPIQLKIVDCVLEDYKFPQSKENSVVLSGTMNSTSFGASNNFSSAGRTEEWGRIVELQADTGNLFPGLLSSLTSAASGGDLGHKFSIRLKDSPAFVIDGEGSPFCWFNGEIADADTMRPLSSSSSNTSSPTRNSTLTATPSQKNNTTIVPVLSKNSLQSFPASSAFPNDPYDYFFLTGWLMGTAIANGVHLPIPLPSVLTQLLTAVTRDRMSICGTTSSEGMIIGPLTRQLLTEENLLLLQQPSHLSLIQKIRKMAANNSKEYKKFVIDFVEAEGLIPATENEEELASKKSEFVNKYTTTNKGGRFSGSERFIQENIIDRILFLDHKNKIFAMVDGLERSSLPELPIFCHANYQDVHLAIVGNAANHDDGISNFSFEEYFNIEFDALAFSGTNYHSFIFKKNILELLEGRALKAVALQHVRDLKGANNYTNDQNHWTNRILSLEVAHFKRLLLKFITGTIYLPAQKKCETIQVQLVQAADAMVLSSNAKKRGENDDQKEPQKKSKDIYRQLLHRLPSSHTCNNVFEVPHYLEGLLFAGPPPPSSSSKEGRNSSSAGARHLKRKGSMRTASANSETLANGENQGIVESKKGMIDQVYFPPMKSFSAANHDHIEEGRREEKVESSAVREEASDDDDEKEATLGGGKERDLNEEISSEIKADVWAGGYFSDMAKMKIRKECQKILVIHTVEAVLTTMSHEVDALSSNTGHRESLEWQPSEMQRGGLTGGIGGFEEDDEEEEEEWSPKEQQAAQRDLKTIGVSELVEEDIIPSGLYGRLADDEDDNDDDDVQLPVEPMQNSPIQRKPSIRKGRPFSVEGGETGNPFHMPDTLAMSSNSNGGVLSFGSVRALKKLSLENPLESPTGRRTLSPIEDAGKRMTPLLSEGVTNFEEVLDLSPSGNSPQRNSGGALPRQLSGSFGSRKHLVLSPGSKPVPSMSPKFSATPPLPPPRPTAGGNAVPQQETEAQSTAEKMKREHTIHTLPNAPMDMDSMGSASEPSSSTSTSESSSSAASSTESSSSSLEGGGGKGKKRRKIVLRGKKAAAHPLLSPRKKNAK